MIIDDPALGVDYSRVVHGDQRFVYTRPIFAGDELTCVCMVEEIMSRGGHDFLTTRTDVTDATRRAGGHRLEPPRRAGAPMSAAFEVGSSCPLRRTG